MASAVAPVASAARQATKPSGRTRTAPSGADPVGRAEGSAPAFAATSPASAVHQVSVEPDAEPRPPRPGRRPATRCPAGRPAGRSSRRTGRAWTPARPGGAARRAARASPAGHGSRAGAGAAAPRRPARSLRLGDDRGRVVAVAEFQVEVVDHRLRVRGAQVGRHPADVPRVGLLDGELADRAALRVVGGEQAGARRTVQHGGELPREVVRVVHAGVAAEAAVRRDHVHGVAGQEDPPVASTARRRRRRPARCAMSSMTSGMPGTPIAARSSSSARSLVIPRRRSPRARPGRPPRSRGGRCRRPG